MLKRDEIVSDYHSVLNIYTRHKVVETKAEAAKKAIEPGTLEIMIGSSSEDIRLGGIFEVK